MTEPPQTAEPTPPPGTPRNPPGQHGQHGGDGHLTGPPPGTPADARRRAALAGTAVSLLLILAIVLGSRLLHDFDSALLPYAVATVFLAFGIAYRYTVWISAPGARRLFRQGWRSFFSAANFRKAPTALPRMIATYLGFQKFLGARSHARWAAHQLVFWGCLLAAAITFPLTWGWFTFTSATGAGPGYEMRIWGFKIIGFDALSPVGWLMFHGLDIAAVLVIAGAAYFLWRRMKDRGAITGQRFAYDLVPLIALIVVSVTGLLLTFSSIFLHGGGYEFLAVLHMVSVVFTLIYIPFGKFFHIVQRPAAVGMQLFKYTSRREGEEEILTCRRCHQPIDTAPYVENLQSTMRDLELGFDAWTEYCPRCKRVLRGNAYLDHVKKGYK
ncbi:MULTISPECIES: MFS transporter [unclassified Streptomyces]|uniref:MFS transporter n=1 Tax=unclassified Streptomyces TaxID=2593676 RepID=UPI00166113E5|nr:MULTISPECIES: MFS transporter [unclassified Streptomyces]MBD0709999.1 MFS transporter [Streptomyces sp. CBMA291]MBD0713817.1 MFS transporter [Streptomyces sp. CBMA370]